MATVVNATCSECFLMQRVELNPRRREIACEFCSHSVPNFEHHDMAAISSAVSQERTKTYIALGLFAGALFLYGLYVYLNSADDLVVVEGKDGVVKYSGELVDIKRDESWIVLRDPDTGEETPQLFFEKVLAEEIEQVKQDNPLMNDDEAARRAGEIYVKAERHEAGATPLLILAALAALGAIASSAIATQDRLVCEF